MREIGSEFWIDSVPERPCGDDEWTSRFGFHGDSRLLLSGRTAIDLICQDLTASHTIKSVYLPAYCCHSMVYPFQRHGIATEFYDVELSADGLHSLVDLQCETDIFYLSNYFGFGTGVEPSVLTTLKSRGIAIVYDRTHGLFEQDRAIAQLADYTFCSLRKWLGIASGAIVSKKVGEFCTTEQRESLYVRCKSRGMRMKSAYIHGDSSVRKVDFFAEFSTFHDFLQEDYDNYVIDNESETILQGYDFDTLQAQRKRNAKILYQGLADVDGISCLFAADENVVPLFVPIVVDTSQRDHLRQHLVDNQIYCPIHWPKSATVPNGMKAEDLYARELSLVCDQRYSEDDMQRVVELIKQFFHE